MRRRSSRRPSSLAELRPLKLAAASLPDQVRIFGIDPGSLITGYAVIDCTGVHTRYVASGSIRTIEEQFPHRLAEIFLAVSQLISQYQPSEIAIERIFMHRNADSALKLGQARGAALCATLSVQPRIFEYAAREVKQAVVGTGSAHKQQVQLMVKKLLNLSGKLSVDAADAIAVALCHAHTRRVRSIVQSSGGR